MDKEVTSSFPITYHNNMNKVSFRNFTARELNLFFIICGIMKDSELNQVKIKYQDIKNLLQADYPNNKIFEENLKSIYDKLLKLDISYETDEKYVKFILFTDYVINKKEKNVEIQVNEKFYPLLNQLTKNFTKFEFKEFSSLNSIYAKHLYRLLKQYKHTGKLFLTVEEFKRLLVIPETYEWFRINDKVLKPIINELSPIFKNLTIEKIKKGRSITHITITFDSEKLLIESVDNDELLCPYCGEELVAITSSQNKIFYGHKHYPSGKCTATFSSIEDIAITTKTKIYNTEIKEKLESSEKKLIEEIKKFCSDHKDKFSFVSLNGNEIVLCDKEFSDDINIVVKRIKIKPNRNIIEQLEETIKK